MSDIPMFLIREQAMQTNDTAFVVSPLGELHRP